VPGKLTFHYANSDHSFSSVAELRDALLASYPGVGFLGRPIVLINRDEPAPAWGWLVDLLRTRTDWWPAVGVALQHAANDGGDHARIALADFLDTYLDSIVLLDWTAPIAAHWPDVVAGLSGSNFGQPDHKLATIIAGQQQLVAGQRDAAVELEGLTADGGYAAFEVKTEAELAALLARAAAAGVVDGNPPWAWLVGELEFHPELRPWLPAVLTGLAGAGEGGRDLEVAAMLDWFSEQHDLWRHLDLLDAWQRITPTWWSTPADKKPANWRQPVRSLAGGARTFGELATAVLARAQQQAQTAPVIDLQRLF
jgi:hypothetical protein